MFSASSVTIFMNSDSYESIATIVCHCNQETTTKHESTASSALAASTLSKSRPIALSHPVASSAPRSLVFNREIPSEAKKNIPCKNCGKCGHW